MMSALPRFLSVAVSLMLTCGCLPSLGGCAAGARPRPVLSDMPQARSLPMFDGLTGDPVDWPSLLRRAQGADVVFLGEEHDDALAHAVQQAVVTDIIEQVPGRTAVSMEMLERHEQPLVDRYLAGDLARSEFIEQTDSAGWGGEEHGWEAWYQPMIDAARDADLPAVAANAPREVVRSAQSMSFDEMRDLPEYADALFDLPLTFESNAQYRSRFFEIMGAPSEPDGAAAGAQPATSSDEGAAGAHGGPMSHETAVMMLRSQMIWDATMANAISEALASGAADRVIHIVGRFHVEHQGGTVSELLARRPDARPLSIIISGDAAASLQPEDRGAGDIVIYTSKRE